MTTMTVYASNRKKMTDVTRVSLRRTGGSTFELKITHADGTIERILNDTSGKLDSVQVDFQGKAFPEEAPQTIVMISGSGVGRTR